MKEFTVQIFVDNMKIGESVSSKKDNALYLAIIAMDPFQEQSN